MSAYLLYVLLATAQHQAWPIFSTIVLALVLPLTAITLAVVGVRASTAVGKRTQQGYPLTERGSRDRCVPISLPPKR
jgi:hypothetical protein